MRPPLYKPQLNQNILYCLFIIILQTATICLSSKPPTNIHNHNNQAIYSQTLTHTVEDDQQQQRQNINPNKNNNNNLDIKNDNNNNFDHINSQQQHANQPQQQNNLLKDETRKILVEKLKINLLNALGLKEAPKKPRNKVYVPREMLERYRQLRESVRDTIPEDKEYYGKLPVHDLEANHEDFWDAIYNKHGSFDIEVDMSGKHNLPHSATFEGDAGDVICLAPVVEPEIIDPSQEELLYPFEHNRQFLSVLLKFNLTQEIFVDPLNPEDIRAAQLHLHRKKISGCDNGHCNNNKPKTFITDSTSKTQQSPPTIEQDNLNKQQNINSDSEVNDRTNPSEDLIDNALPHVNSTRLRNRPRFQRIYILKVLGYDAHNDFKTHMFSSFRVNTYDTSVLKIDISRILKEWLEDPSKNHGLIVRVTNDDQEYERINLASLRTSEQHQSNASKTNIEAGQDFEKLDLSEHVRLKRDFRSEEGNDEVWIAKRPSLLIYSNPPEVVRSHVKREDTDSALANKMQADDPGAGSPTTIDFSGGSNSPRTPNQTNEDNQNTSDSYTTKPHVPSPKPSNPNRNRASSANNRNTNKNNASNRTGSPRATSTGQGSRPKQPKPKPKVEKCGKKTLSINFDEVGWSSWIIAPLAYYADYCVGDCSFPMSDHQNATNHAIIQSIYNIVGRMVPRSCCAPVKLGRMAILYQIDGGVQMKQYDDMIVESCGCL